MSANCSRIRCNLCPKACELEPGERGACRIRVNMDGRMIALTYGKPCAVHIDPVEKKPMFHFLPGTPILSIATAGCNLHCKFCQNWEISQSNPEDTDNSDMPPEALVRAAIRYNCPSIAYTYSEPMAYYEYTRDSSKLARSQGLKNVLVTAGYINEDPLRELCRYADGANVDLKGFTDDFYREICDGDLATILRNLRIMKDEGVFIEVTNLIVPTLNDDPEMIRSMCGWLTENLGPEMPLHFSRFYPMYLLRDLYPTPEKTLRDARRIAIEEGLHYVYVGNIPGVDEDTMCPGCGAKVIGRVGFRVVTNRLADGACPDCGTKIAGVWK